MVSAAFPVASNIHDGFWGSDNSFDSSSSTLQFGVVSGVSNKVWLLFENVNIPQGADILSAEISVVLANLALAGTATITVRGSNVDSAAAPVDAFDAESQPRTIQYEDVEISGTWIVGTPKSISNLQNVLQEIVDRPGWTSGNSIIFYLEGWSGPDNTGRIIRSAATGSPPTLNVEYEYLSLNSSATLTGLGVVDHAATADIQSVSRITADAVDTTPSSAQIFINSSLVATGRKTLSSNAILISGTTINGTGTVTINGSGGIVGSGVALVESPLYHFRPTGLPPIILSGSAVIKAVINTGQASGGVLIEGSAADASLVARVITEGGVEIGTDERSSNPDLILIDAYDFFWRTNQSATVEYEFSWSTGQQRSYFFRVIGRGKTDVCDPLQGDECCKKFVVNIQARTLEDVCRKLRERVGAWPVEKIQRFSRPAERTAIEEDIQNGIDHNCNILEDVDFCKVPICADFCVEYDLRENWGAYSILESTELSAMGIRSLAISRKHFYKGQGGIELGGTCQSRTKRDFRFTSIARMGKLGGSAHHYSTNYRYESQGGISVVGTSGRKTPNWRFKAGEWPIYTEPIVPKEAVGWDKEKDGSYFCMIGSQSSPMLVLKGFDHEIPENGRLSGVIVEIDRFANGLIQDAEIMMFRGGSQSPNFAKDYNWPIALSVSSLYGSATENWGLSDSGEFALGIRVRPVANRPDLKSVVRSVRVTFAYDQGAGKLIFGGKAGSKSSHFRMAAKGGIHIKGKSSSKILEFKPPESSKTEIAPLVPVQFKPILPSPNKGLLIRALSTTTTSTTITSIDQDVVPELEALSLTVNKCNCSSMPLRIPFSHNLSKVNKLSQFVQRNGQTISNFSTLQYNKTNESWQTNLRYSGSSAFALDNEIWSILFELQCTDILGGTSIGQGVWRFGMRVIQKNLGTGQDYDTRLMAAFLPDPICSRGREFRVKLSFDTELKVATTNPISTIYDVVIYDNIGLFKSSSWLESPRLLIDMSQSGIPPNTPRTVINFG